jgi:predicted flap endonuclease-1-like 5' DNA nuclease
MKEDEVMEFEVIEFSKDSKRIIVSHTNIWKGAERAKADQDDKGREKSRKNASKTVKKINQTSERTTLGELDALTELRAQFEKAENKPKAEKKAAKVEVEETVEATAVESSDAKSIADLKDLTGVGPAMVKRMNGLGVNSISELTSLTSETITELSAQDAKISVEQWNKWIEEAKG